jgi:hydrogenase nickel incorporation protein HypA/HybF
MHEMGIALQIIDIVKSSIPADLTGVPVERVNLKVGKFSAVIPENLRFCFQVATQDTLLSGAQLHIEEIPVTARCKECENRWEIQGPTFSCPTCSSGFIEILTGRELDIESIELADDSASQPANCP